MHNRSISVAQRVAPALLRFTLGAAVPLLALSATQPAVAAPAKFDVEAVKKQLLSGNGEEIAKALETIKQAGAAAKPIVPTLNSVLKKGSTTPL
ncbi:MAG: hypothetical protein AB7S68_19965 [Polyangiaceae bacterium]